MWRAFYQILGWEYTGRREQGQRERQGRLKYLCTEQIKNSNFRMKPTKIKFLEKLINKKNKNRR